LSLFARTQRITFASSDARIISNGGSILGAVQLENAAVTQQVSTLGDPDTERAYVEFRAKDDDGGEIITTTIFSFRSKTKLNKPQIKQEIARSCIRFIEIRTSRTLSPPGGYPRNRKRDSDMDGASPYIACWSTPVIISLLITADTPNAFVLTFVGHYRAGFDFVYVFACNGGHPLRFAPMKPKALTLVCGTDPQTCPQTVQA
jgi:hypothetical protein